jgi:hypothetical protein
MKPKTAARMAGLHRENHLAALKRHWTKANPAS